MFMCCRSRKRCNQYVTIKYINDSPPHAGTQVMYGARIRFFVAIPVMNEAAASTSNHFTFLAVVNQYRGDPVPDSVTDRVGFQSWMLRVRNWGNEGTAYEDHSLYATPIDMLTHKVCMGHDANERYLIQFDSAQHMR